jgi:ribosomal-protein-alanine N-acetyltransferase
VVAVSFTEIGVAPAYLRIAGAWRDHLLFQRVADSNDDAYSG